MIPYNDIDGDSGVSGYETGSDFIKVQFKNDGKIYTWTYGSAGAGNVEEMKRLAMSGDGLNSFIMKNVRDSYAFKT